VLFPGRSTVRIARSERADGGLECFAGSQDRWVPRIDVLGVNGAPKKRDAKT